MKTAYLTLVLSAVIATSLIAQDPCNINHIGSFFNTGEYVSMKYNEADNILYSATGYGFVIIDADDPFELEKLGEIPLPGISTDLAVIGDLAYVVDGDLYVISIDDFEDPQILNEVQFDHKVYQIASQGEYLYLTGPDNTFYVVSIQDPLNPRLISTIENVNISCEFEIRFNYIFVESEIRIFDDLLFIADEVCSIWHLNDPAQPELLSSFEAGPEDRPQTSYDLAVYDDYAYLIGRYGQYELAVYSIEDPRNPELVNTISYNLVGNFSDGSLCLYDDYLAFAFVDGVFIYSLEDPSSPQMISSIDRGRFSYDLIAGGEYLFLSNCYAGIQAFWMGDIEDPEPGTPFKPFAQFHDINTAGNMVVAGMYGGFGVLSMNDPDNIEHQIYHNDCEQLIFVETDGENVYAAGDLLQIYSGEDVDHLQVIFEQEIPGNAHDIAVEDNRLAVLCGDQEQIGWDDMGQPEWESVAAMQVYDISNPEDPELLSEYEWRNRTPLDDKIELKDDLILITYRGTFEIYGISERGDIDLLFALYRNQYHSVNNFQIEGDTLFCIDGQNYYTYSLEDPCNPHRLTLTQLPDDHGELIPFSSFKCGSNLILTYDIYQNHYLPIEGLRGIYIYDITDNRSFVLNGCTNTPGIIEDIVIKDNTVFVADRYSLEIYDISEALTSPDISLPPEKYRLWSAYPNPFNNSTRINYTVPATGMISLSLFDQTGRLVNVLAEGASNAGKYSLVLDGQRFASGTYLLKLVTNGNIDYRQLTLLR